jgi:hypothetical protein
MIEAILIFVLVVTLCWQVFVSVEKSKIIESLQTMLDNSREAEHNQFKKFLTEQSKARASSKKAEALFSAVRFYSKKEHWKTSRAVIDAGHTARVALRKADEHEA